VLRSCSGSVMAALAQVDFVIIGQSPSPLFFVSMAMARWTSCLRAQSTMCGFLLY
jgi:hypothetical protein